MSFPLERHIKLVFTNFIDLELFARSIVHKANERLKPACFYFETILCLFYILCFLIFFYLFYVKINESFVRLNYGCIQFRIYYKNYALRWGWWIRLSAQGKLYYPKPEAEGNGGCRIWSVTLHTENDCFYSTESLSFTHLVYLCTLCSFKTQLFFSAWNCGLHSKICVGLQTDGNCFSIIFGIFTASKSSSFSSGWFCSKIQVKFQLNHRIKLWNFSVYITIIINEICFSTCFYNWTPHSKSYLSPVLSGNRRFNYFLPNSVVIYRRNSLKV